MNEEEAFKIYELPMTATQKEVNKKYAALIKKYPPSSKGEKLDMYIKICEAKKVITAHIKKTGPKKAPVPTKPEENTCPKCKILIEEIYDLQKKFNDLDEKRKSSILQISQLNSIIASSSNDDLVENNEILRESIERLIEEKLMLRREIDAVRKEILMLKAK